MNQLIEDLLHNHTRTGMLLNDLACQIRQLQINVDSLKRHVEALRNERDRLQHDVEFRAMGGKH
jgi:predicted RNase H-like nuclease (RuvC/YqgF family)